MNYATFRKPSRYIGNEINIVRKEGKIKVALCFPDTYEIGMSHIGLKILYSIINNIPEASAERVFAPWVDMETYLRDNNLFLASLEFQRPLKEFDIVGFTLQYELSFTNILNMLDLGGIPVRSSQRDEDHPLIIAGGPCSVNPLTLAPFMDAFVIGDGEEVIKEIVSLYSGNGNKGDILNSLSKIEGVYVPSIHDKDKQTIKRRFIEDLDKAPYPDSPVLPYASLVHDRVAIEVARGCTRGCRFCQAGMTYRPLRERSPQTIFSLSEKSLARTGYDEISFASLNTGDYSCLLPLIRSFNKRHCGSNISVSLPSLRVGSLSSEVLKEIKSVRKTGFTIAPEAGTERLRNVINKDFTEDEYEDILKKLFTEGWNHVKLYFMIGLPTETMSDINGIIDMSIKALKKGRGLTRRRVNVNVGISSFVPKPHTPFQWTGQNNIEELREKQDYIKKVFRKKGINFKGSHVELSLLEAVFSRADARSALLLEEAWKLGCRFDAWSEHFDFSKWKTAAEKAGVDLYSCASHTFDMEEDLPWDFIDTGITRQFLKSEYKKALEETITRDCRDNCCACGLDCGERTGHVDHGPQYSENTEYSSKRARTDKVIVPCSLRVRFSKTGEMRYLSHNELITCIFRALRRADIPFAYSSGFHPHPKLSFSPALPSGVEGLNEFFDIELTAIMHPDDFLQSVNSVLPKGIKLLSAARAPGKKKSLNDLFSRYEYELTIDNSLEKHVNSFMASRRCDVSRKNKSVDIRPMVESAKIEGKNLRIVLADTEKANMRLYEILQELLQMTPEAVQSLMIKRTALYGYNSDNPTETEKENRLCRAK